jgi:hypothetical protein
MGRRETLVALRQVGCPFPYPSVHVNTGGASQGPNRAVARPGFLQKFLHLSILGGPDH